MTNRSKRFLVCAGLTFVLVLAVLFWLGPVWIHDVEDHLLAFFGAIFIVIFGMALLVGAPVAAAAEVAVTTVVEVTAQVTVAAAEAGGHGVLFLHRLTRGAGPAILGVLLGSSTALIVMWGLSHAEPLRLVYARARPTRALANDFVRVAKVLDDHKKVHGRPPADAAALGRALEAARVELRFSTLREGIWRDAWDRPMVYEAKRSLFGWKVEVYSLGINGRDDQGKPDDISIRETFKLWKFSRLIGAALEKYFEEKR